MSHPLQKTIYTGTFISTPKLDTLDIAEHQAVGVDEDGVIRHKSDLSPDGSRHDPDDLEIKVKAIAVAWGWGEEGWKWVQGGKEGQSWWFPGFVDTHIHASQYSNCGVFGKSTLLDWLKTYTYPVEASLSDPEKARKVYTSCVARTLSHGTTTASYFATAHASSTNILADICHQKGQRAFIGRVCMDTDLSPEYYRDESPEFAIKETKAVISHIDSFDPEHKLITPILTPRFAPSCSRPLLTSLGDLASETQLPIQSHISENPSEVALVHSMFPEHATYVDVYAAYNLLTPRTVLAHAIHLTPPELSLLASAQTSISHCPASNTSLSSGLCPVRTLLSHSITVSLGTDISGGYSSSILTACREAVMVSRTLAAITPSDDDKTKTPTPSGKETTTPPPSAKDIQKLSVEESLYLATLGGAHALNLSSKIGAFDLGMDFDAQLITLSSPSLPPPSPSTTLPPTQSSAHPHPSSPTAAATNKLSDSFTALSETPESSLPIQTPPSSIAPPPPSNQPRIDEGLVDLWGTETWGEKVAKWVFCGDDRNTRRVFVRGRLVHDRA